MCFFLPAKNNPADLRYNQVPWKPCCPDRSTALHQEDLWRSLEVSWSRRLLWWVTCLLFVARDDLVSEEDEDEEELDSRNCTIDDDRNESIIMHPRVVLPQSSTKKRLLNSDDDPDFEKTISPSKRLRFDDSHSIVNIIHLVSMHTHALFLSRSIHRLSVSLLKRLLNVIHLSRRPRRRTPPDPF